MSEFITFDANVKDAEKVQKAIAKAPQALERELVQAFNDYSQVYISDVRTKHFGSKTTSTKLKNRSGRLRRIFSKWFTKTLSQGLIKLILLDPLARKYGPLQEYGGTISAKPGKMLIVPTSEAMQDTKYYTAAGVQKFRSIRRFVDNKTLFVASHGNVAGLWRSEDAALMFVFKRSVKIPPRLGLREELKRTREEFYSRVDDAASRALKEVGF